MSRKKAQEAQKGKGDRPNTMPDAELAQTFFINGGSEGGILSKSINFILYSLVFLPPAEGV